MNMDKFNNSSKEILHEKSFAIVGDKLYETVYVEPLNTIGYYFFDRNTKEKGFIKRIVIERTDLETDEESQEILAPPVNNLAECGTMLFPQKPTNYGSLPKLILAISGFIDKYLELPSDMLLIASYYVILTWVYDCFDTIPYLRARGEYGTGKSRFLRVIGSLCYHALFAGGASTVSPIFRLIELYGGLTFVLDEADYRYSGPDSEIIKILNTGYSKGMGVLRTEGEKVRTPKMFATFGPKIIATRKEFEDQALESRCLTTYMTGMTRSDIPIALPKSFAKEAEVIRNQLLLFRFEHYGVYDINESLAVPGIEPRVNQVLLPLLAIADSDEVRVELQAYARKQASTQAVSRSDTLEADVLFALLDLAKETTFLPIKKIAERVNCDRDVGRGEYIVSPSKIGRINKISFGFSTRKIRGATEIIWDQQTSDRLRARYNLTLVEHVDLVDQFGLEAGKALEEMLQTEAENSPLENAPHHLHDLPTPEAMV
jgi:hypothetical protein